MDDRAKWQREFNFCHHPSAKAYYRSDSGGTGSGKGRHFVPDMEKH
jgi:hypothetical protein